jgi:hypothetical protein
MEAGMSMSIMDQRKYLLIHFLGDTETSGITTGMVEEAILIEKTMVPFGILRFCVRLLVYLVLDVVDNPAKGRVVFHMLLKFVNKGRIEIQHRCSNRVGRGKDLA